MLIASAICAAQAAATAPTVLSPDHMRIAAATALSSGDAALARIMTGALLKRNPDDAAARLTLSRAEARDGDLDSALAHARRAHQDAESDLVKAEASRHVANYLYKQERYTRSSLWLRRAYQEAPDEATASRARADYGKVRAANPLSMRLSFSTSPSSNINNGSSVDTIEILGVPFDLSPDAQALSGWETSIGLRADYRFQNGLIGGLSFETTDKRLSSEAKDKAPGAKGSDYDTAILSLRLGKYHDVADGKLYTEGSIGQSWFGGSALSHFVKFSADWKKPLDSRTHIGFGATLEHSVPDRPSGSETTTLGVNGRWTRALDDGYLTLSGLVATTESNKDASENDMVRLGAGWHHKKPVLGGKLSLSADVEARDYHTSPYDADGRQDLSLTLGANLFLTQYDYMGFAPTIGVTARKTASNVDLYDREEYGISIGIKSAF